VLFGAAMAACVWAAESPARRLFADAGSTSRDLALLLILVPVGAASYGVLVFLFKKQLLRQLMGRLRGAA
jgi:hypothetical protein